MQILITEQDVKTLIELFVAKKADLISVELRNTDLLGEDDKILDLKEIEYLYMGEFNGESHIL